MAEGEGGTGGREQEKQTGREGKVTLQDATAEVKVMAHFGGNQKMKK